MIIIVEGMDNTGKTTLIEKLHKNLGFPIIKSLGNATQEAHVGWLIDLLHKHEENDHVLVDRCPLISEFVYGPLIRHRNVMWSIAQDWWDELLKIGVIVIYCRPSRDTILGTLTEREQMEGVVSQGTKLLDTYDELMISIRNRLPLIVYNYVDDPQAQELSIDLYSYIKGR